MTIDEHHSEHADLRQAGHFPPYWDSHPEYSLYTVYRQQYDENTWHRSFIIKTPSTIKGPSWIRNTAKNLISSPFAHHQHFLENSLKSVCNILSYFADSQMDGQTNASCHTFGGGNEDGEIQYSF